MIFQSTNFRYTLNVRYKRSLQDIINEIEETIKIVNATKGILLILRITNIFIHLMFRSSYHNYFIAKHILIFFLEPKAFSLDGVQVCLEFFMCFQSFIFIWMQFVTYRVEWVKILNNFSNLKRFYVNAILVLFHLMKFGMGRRHS